MLVCGTRSWDTHKAELGSGVAVISGGLKAASLLVGGRRPRSACCLDWPEAPSTNASRLVRRPGPGTNEPEVGFQNTFASSRMLVIQGTPQIGCRQCLGPQDELHHLLPFQEALQDHQGVSLQAPFK